MVIYVQYDGDTRITCCITLSECKKWVLVARKTSDKEWQGIWKGFWQGLIIYEKMSATSPPHVRISPSPVSRTTLSDLGVFRCASIYCTDHCDSLTDWNWRLFISQVDRGPSVRPSVTDDEDDQPSSPVGALIPGEGWQNTRVIKKLSWRPGLTCFIKLLDQRFHPSSEERILSILLLQNHWP